MVKNVLIAALLVGFLLLAGYLYDQSSAEIHTPPTTGAIEIRDDVQCAQVITPALDPDTGNIVEFPTPCDVPEGWLVVENDVPDLDLEVQ